MNRQYDSVDYASNGVAETFVLPRAVVSLDLTKAFSLRHFFQPVHILRHSQLRVTYSEKILSMPICCSADGYAYFIEIWDKAVINLQEQVYVLYLNVNNQVIGWRLLNTGTGAQTLVDIKLALAIALNCMASKIIIAHNHPTGSLKPSYGDIKETEKLKNALVLVDIKLEDSLIITRKGYYSFRDHLLLKG